MTLFATLYELFECHDFAGCGCDSASLEFEEREMALEDQDLLTEIRGGISSSQGVPDPRAAATSTRTLIAPVCVRTGGSPFTRDERGPATTSTSEDTL